MAAMGPPAHVADCHGGDQRVRAASQEDSVTEGSARVALYANEVRARASLLPQGIGKDALLKKADQAGYPLRRLPPDPTGGIADAEIKTPSHAAGRDP